MDKDKNIGVSCTSGDRGGLRVTYFFPNECSISVEMDKGEALKIVCGCIEVFGQMAVLDVVAPLKTICAGTLSPLPPDFEQKWLHRLGACSCEECKEKRAQATIQPPPFGRIYGPLPESASSPAEEEPQTETWRDRAPLL